MRNRTEEDPLRRVVALELVSVDGVMEKPEEWAFAYSNDEMDEANAAGMEASDALLLGRVTYEGLAAFWPNQPAGTPMVEDRKSTRLNSSHANISYAVFCLKKKNDTLYLLIR